MTVARIFKRLLLTLVLGIYLIFAIGGAAIASAAVSGNMPLAYSIITPMISAAMSWLTVLGIPFLVCGSYMIYEAMIEGLTEIGEAIEEIATSLSKKKNDPQNIGHFDRLSINEGDDHKPDDSDLIRRSFLGSVQTQDVSNKTAQIGR